MELSIVRFLLPQVMVGLRVTQELFAILLFDDSRDSHRAIYQDWYFSNSGRYHQCTRAVSENPALCGSCTGSLNQQSFAAGQTLPPRQETSGRSLQIHRKKWQDVALTEATLKIATN